MNLKSLVLILLAAVLGACAGSRKAAPNLEPPRCDGTETFVCYGGKASRLDTDSYNPRFCRCEKSIQRL